jgi:sterol desaturase/sphingolipid hydroxylase (fatty acid hydroxylase superfamily)
MPHLPWYVWALGALAVYAAVSFALDLACRTLFAGRRIGGPKRAAVKLPLFNIAALFVINTLQVGLGLALADHFHASGVGGLYVQEIASPLSLLLVAAQAFFILFVFDTNFYWFHRLGHRYRRLFALLHAEHHRPRYPTVWHLQYQHPLDYLATTAAPLAWVALLPLPLSTQSYLIAATIAMFLNIAGHAGHEVSNTVIGLPTPNGWAARLDPLRRGVARFFNNVLHHDLHHQKCRDNYSLYFTFWDRLCGTFNADTDRVEAYVRAR